MPGHRGCSAGGSHCCCSRCSSPQAQAWHLWGVQAGSYPWACSLWGEGALWDSSARAPSAVSPGNSPAPCPCAECSSGGQQPRKTFNLDTAGSLRAIGGQEPSGRGRAWDSQDCCAHTPNVHLDLSLVSWSVGGCVPVWEVTQCVRCI